MFVSALVTGCGGGGGATSPVVRTAYGPNTVVLSHSDSRQVQSFTDSTVTIAGDTSGIHLGSIIASSQGEGLLRKVNGVVSSGATTTFSTTQATIEDAIQTASVRDQRTLGSASVASFIPGGSGITMRSPGGSTPSTTASITLDLNAFQLAGNSGSASGTVSLSGSLDLSVALKTALDVGFFKVKRFSCDAAVTAEAFAQLSGSLSIQLEKKVLLGTLVGVPFDFVPGVEVTPIISLYCVVSGTMEDGFTITTSASVTGEAGVKYENGSWSTSHSVTHSLNLTPALNLYSSMTVDYTPVRCELTMLMDGIVGPYVSVDAPTFEGALQVNTNPAGLELSVSTIYDADIGVKVAILGDDLLDADFSIGLEGKATIYDHFFPSNGSGGVNIN